jgi:tRNA-splicing ligase RtcB
VIDTPNFTVFHPEGIEPYENAIDQMANCLSHPGAVKGALMADHHLGYAMPIGGVVAYEDHISPTGVGYDIACGNMAVRTDLTVNELVDVTDVEDYAKPDLFVERLKPIMREIQKKVEFGVGGKSKTPVEHELFDSAIWSEINRQFGTDLKEKARAQLGTVGSGNHYVDLLYDDEGNVWIANHFGSRGLGHSIASGFMAAAEGLDFTDRTKESENGVVFSTKEELGTFYVAAMQLAGEYAYAGREFVIEQVLGILGNPEVTATVHNHHNYAWFENGLWVVRKGATPLTTEPAFIGGSMGDISVIVKGKVSWPPSEIELDAYEDWSRNGKTVVDIGAIGSAPHGAGRVMSRTAAAGKLRKMWVCSERDCDFQVRSEGNKPPPEHEHKMRKVRTRDKSTAAIDWDFARDDLKGRGICVLGAGADESPGVYKPLADVIEAHSNIEVLEVLRPLGVVMASPDTFDPYKD